ncbi:MAG: PKD domain-containing protein [Gammaproteobacteria bacterium]|nr:PKD domain-containing protein [Gammaproteobacteria bacterium]
MKNILRGMDMFINQKLFNRSLNYLAIFTVILFFILSATSGAANAARSGSDSFTIEGAKWDARKNRIEVKGRGNDGQTVTVTNAGDINKVIGEDAVDHDKWRVRSENPASIPCRVRAEQSDGKSAEKDVSNAPADCDDGGTPPPVNNPPVCTIDTPAGNLTINVGDTVNYTATVSDADNDPLSISWSFGGGSPLSSNVEDAGVISYSSAGVFTTTLTADDGQDSCATQSRSITVQDNVPPPPIPNVSINSTSVNGKPGVPVSEQPFTGQSDYVLLSINDLGMHCGDFDTRISSVLPPFNVMHTQVIRRGSEPDILTPADGVEVVYSASSNPNDPILTGINSAGSGPVLSSMLPDGSVYKTNFWDVAREAYDPFYPSGILPLFFPAGPVANILDNSLPMPNVERFYLGDGFLSAEQQGMPALGLPAGVPGPYAFNDPQVSNIFTIDQPFFTGFPFGYVAEGVDWYEAAGIPLTAFDDFGRENPWALMRVQAVAGGQTLASLDTVLPISGEANCGFCHNDPADGGNGAATANMQGTVTLSIHDEANVPMEVSNEWAADINVLRLHDQKHGTSLIVGTTQDDPPGTAPFTAVVCQTCHYTPALDLAQLGPLGPENDAQNIVLNGGTLPIASLANGRDQIKHKSMSNVMHSHHATVTGVDGVALFPDMPPAVDANGNFRDPILGREVMEATCYQCHPGRRTDCLRGAMATGGMLCQDCHGDMEQVGNDFTRNVTPANPGDFLLVGVNGHTVEELGTSFYDPDAAQPRVPWANEPGCGSCHTGDAMDNMHGTAGTVSDPEDGIRLMQAYLSTDTKATPIVPSNKRFAENTVPATFDGVPNNGAGNPMLYRVSKGHEGVFCEACHGATHGIWPNGNPNANDNVASLQLQGHTGTISECSTCHTGDLGDDLDGPHGMHAVGSAGVHFAEGGHAGMVESNPDACRACHGQNGEGTVLSRMFTDRVLECDNETAFCPDGNSQLFPKGYQVTCTDCHDNEL